MVSCYEAILEPGFAENTRSSPPGSVEKFLDWIGGNLYAMDNAEVNKKFHEVGLLQEDERMAFAFKTGHNSLYLTNKWHLVFDVQVSFFSCPKANDYGRIFVFSNVVSHRVSLGRRKNTYLFPGIALARRL